MHRRKNFVTPAATVLYRAAPLAGCVLGIAHGCGANLPSLALLQVAAMTALIAILFLAMSNKLPAISVLTALAFSLSSAAAAHAWIYLSLARDSALGAPLATCVFAALVVGLALLPAASLMLGSALVTKNSSARFAPLALAAGYPLAEIASAHLMGFSWHSIGYSALGTPLGELLPIIGVSGIAATSMLVCALLAEWLTGWLCVSGTRKILPWRGLAVLSSVVIGLALLSRTSYLVMTRPTSDPLRVRLLQPAQPMYRKFDSMLIRQTTLQLVALARSSRAHLIVTPETVLPHSWATLPTDLSEPLMSVVENSDRIFLIGLFDMAGGGLVNVSNAVRANSRVVAPQRYAKRHLVPVAEQRTRGLAWVSDALALPFADRVADRGDVTVFSTPRARIRTTICLDLAYGDDLSDTAASTDVLVNQSNLAALPGERVRKQFLTIARARALEQQKPVLLATNDGPTAAIDAAGHVLASLPAGTAGALETQIQPRRGTTWYAIFGAGIWIALLAIAALATAIMPSTSRAFRNLTQ